MSENKIIEIRMPLEAVSDEEAVLPSEVRGPTIIKITPAAVYFEQEGIMRRRLDFRIAFEPQNPERRNQPYRYALDRNAFIED
jgi:hypothetical protein